MGGVGWTILDTDTSLLLAQLMGHVMLVWQHASVRSGVDWPCLPGPEPHERSYIAWPRLPGPSLHDRAHPPALGSMLGPQKGPVGVSSQEAGPPAVVKHIGAAHAWNRPARSRRVFMRLANPNQNTKPSQPKPTARQLEISRSFGLPEFLPSADRLRILSIIAAIIGNLL